MHLRKNMYNNIYLLLLSLFCPLYVTAMENNKEPSTIGSNTSYKNPFKQITRAYSQKKTVTDDELKEFLYTPPSNQEQISTKKYTQASDEYYLALFIQYTRKKSSEAQTKHYTLQKHYSKAIEEHESSNTKSKRYETKNIVFTLMYQLEKSTEACDAANQQLMLVHSDPLAAKIITEYNQHSKENSTIIGIATMLLTMEDYFLKKKIDAWLAINCVQKEPSTSSQK